MENVAVVILLSGGHHHRQGKPDGQAKKRGTQNRVLIGRGGAKGAGLTDGTGRSGE